MADVSSSIRVFRTSDQYPLHYRRYEPDRTPKAHLVCIHGIQSHGGWYESSCRQLSAAGYLVSYLDRRGSGLNWLARGDAPHFEQLLIDLCEFIRATTPAGVPVVLVATSWGGKLGLALADSSRPPFQKLVLLCPGVFPRVKPPMGVRLGIGWSRLVRPERLFDIPLNDPKLFTLSPGWQHFLAHDPLSLHRATARLLVESVRLDRRLRRIRALPRLPVLLLLGDEDRIIHNGRTEAWVKKIAPHSTVIYYPRQHHTLEFEEDRWFVNDIVHWLLK